MLLSLFRMARTLIRLQTYYFARRHNSLSLCSLESMVRPQFIFHGTEQSVVPHLIRFHKIVFVSLKLQLNAPSNYVHTTHEPSIRAYILPQPSFFFLFLLYHYCPALFFLYHYSSHHNIYSTSEHLSHNRSSQLFHHCSSTCDYITTLLTDSFKSSYLPRSSILPYTAPDRPLHCH